MSAGEEALNYAVLPAKAAAAMAKVWKVVEAAGAGIKAVPMMAGAVKHVRKHDESYVAYSKERRRRLGLDSGKMNTSGANRENLTTHDDLTTQGTRSKIEDQFKSSKINLMAEGHEVVKKYIKIHSSEINATKDVNDLINQTKMMVPQKLSTYVARKGAEKKLDMALLDDISEYEISFSKTLKMFLKQNSVKKDPKLLE